MENCRSFVRLASPATLQFVDGTKLRFEYEFLDPALLSLASTVEYFHSDRARFGTPDNNRRLAMTGDHVARLILSTKWIERNGTTGTYTRTLHSSPQAPS
jgi:hypothetical protein